MPHCNVICSGAFFCFYCPKNLFKKGLMLALSMRGKTEASFPAISTRCFYPSACNSREQKMSK